MKKKLVKNAINFFNPFFKFLRKKRYSDFFSCKFERTFKICIFNSQELTTKEYMSLK